MKKHLLAPALACAMCASALQASVERVLIDRDWTFTLEGEAPTVVDLPHDWSIYGPYSKDAPAGNDGAYLPAGKAVYQKVIYIPSIDADSRYSLEFEGVYMHSRVSVNGREVGGQPYGYTSFACDITDALVPGQNTVTVTVDNSRQKNSRWYSGSGIYRHVWLRSHSSAYLSPHSLFVTTPVVGPDRARVCVSYDITNDAGEARSLDVVTVLRHDGVSVAENRSRVEVPAGATVPRELAFDVASPSLWSPDLPSLYQAEVTLYTGGEALYTQTESFGIRTFEFDADRGLTLNGEPLVLCGGCVHHDNGILGARSYDSAEARKVRLMKQAGFNAVRTSHNPPSPAFLDECDRQGLIVIDEAFDGWRDSKTDHDYAETFDSQWCHDVGSMVRRDRNHPSVMAWSIGNEVIERKRLEVVTTARHLADECRALDPTRPVTSALASWDSDWDIYDPLAAVHDIVGYNYMIHKAESDHQRVPGRVMWQTESYPRDAFSNWAMVNDHPYVIGDFVWTAIDYLGESGIGRHYYDGEVEGEHWERPLWPWHGALCGDIDITGHRRPISHYRQILFAPETSDSIYMAVREPDGYSGKVKETLWGTYPTCESWTWPGHEGSDIDVEVYSRYPKVQLYLDGKLVGEKPTGRDSAFKATFTLPYTSGTLTAVGIDESGRRISVQPRIATAGKVHALRATSVKEGSDGLTYITIEAVDRHGNVVPNAQCRVSCQLKGAGEILAVGSADMKDTEPYTTPEATLHQGRALAVVRADGASFTASAPGVKPARVNIK